MEGIILKTYKEGKLSCGWVDGTHFHTTHRAFYPYRIVELIITPLEAVEVVKAIEAGTGK